MADRMEAGDASASPCVDPRTLARSRAGYVTASLRLGPVRGFWIGLVTLLVAAAHLAQARDLDGRYANSPLKQWFDGLRSGKGPCCSDADGSAVSDVDWESKDGHYRVRLDGQWIDVPDEAVVTEPNRVGRAMVWPIRGYSGITIRCFMPGSMT